MRRGMGLADIFLYILLMFLLSIAILIVGLDSVTKTTIEIDESHAQHLVRTSIVERSVVESFALIPVEGVAENVVVYYDDDRVTIDYGELHASRSESLSMIASYVLYNVVGRPDDARPLYSVFYREPVLHAAPMRVRTTPTEHDRIGPVVPRRGDSSDLWLEQDGDSAFEVGIEESVSHSEDRLVWVPGYVGPHIHARGVYLSFRTPLGVALDEG